MLNLRTAIIVIVAVIGSSVATGFVVHNQTKANSNTQQSQNNNGKASAIRNVSENTNTSPLNTNVTLPTNTNNAPVVNTAVIPKIVTPKPKPAPVVNTTTAVDPAIKIELCKAEANDAVVKRKNDFVLEFLKEVCDSSHGFCKTEDELMAQYSNPQDPHYYANPVTRQQAVDSYLTNQATQRATWFDGMMTDVQPIYNGVYNPTYEACLKKS